MSLEAIFTLICDGCGARWTGAQEDRFSHVRRRAQSIRFGAKRDGGWLTLNRGRYLTETHYCPQCRDKPIKPVPRISRVPWYHGISHRDR